MDKTQFAFRDAKVSTDRAVLSGIEVKHLIDECPDLSYLESDYEYTEASRDDEGRFTPAHLTIKSSCQFSQKDVEEDGIAKVLGWIRQNEERLEAYNRGSWWCVGIVAEATILLPHGTARKIQTISSGGLWGIESDSSNDYFKSEEDGQIDEVLGYLKALNVEVPKDYEVVRP